MLRRLSSVLDLVDRKKLGLIIILIIMYLAVYYNHTWMHENAHKRIAEEYGLKGEIHMNYFFGNSYTAIINSKEEELSVEELQQMRMLHAQNEIVGYNVDNLILAVFMIPLFMILMRRND